jgi:hypothetical protein
MRRTIGDEQELLSRIPTEPALIRHAHDPHSSVSNKLPEFLIGRAVRGGRAREPEVIEPEDAVLQPTPQARVPELA